MHIDIGFNYRKFPEFRDKEEELRYHQLWANKLPPDDAPKVARTLKLSEDADDTLDSQQPESCATGSGAAIQRKVVYQAGRRFVWVVPVFPSWNPWSTANRDNTVLEKDPTRRTCTVQIHKALADLQPGFDQLPEPDCEFELELFPAEIPRPSVDIPRSKFSPLYVNGKPLHGP